MEHHERYDGKGTEFDTGLIDLVFDPKFIILEQFEQIDREHLDDE